MSLLKTKMSETLSNNKVAMYNAARIEAGRVIIKRTIKALKDGDAMPMMFKMFLDTPFAPVIVGNMLSFLINETMPDTKRTEFIKDALIEASASELIGKLNVNEFLTKILRGVNVPKIADDLGEDEVANLKIASVKILEQEEE